MSDYTPKPEHKFTFGLWTVGNVGRDPFGGNVREPVGPTGLAFPVSEIVSKLAAMGAYGINLHDNDLVPIDAAPAERDAIVAEFKKSLADNGMVVPMATTNLFSDPIFKDGAFTSNDPKVRAYALQKTMRSMDLGAELGAGVYVFWGGREGTETDASKDARDSMKRFRDSPELPRRIRSVAGLQLQIRAGTQTERTSRRHLSADRRLRARLYRHARQAGEIRRQPGIRARYDGGPEFRSCRRAGH